MSKTPTCLEGAGALGHTWIATLRNNDDERIYAQVSYGADAVRALDEYKGTESRGDIYERVGRIKRSGMIIWRKRTVGYALLDQPPDRPPYEPATEDAAS